MIKINLLGDDTIRDNSGPKQIAIGVATIVLLLSLCAFINSSLSSEIERMTHEVEDKEAQLKVLEKTTKEVKDLEAKEAEYNSKIAVINDLKRSKVGPVRVLDDLNLAMPERSWITAINEDSGQMRIEGRAVDPTTVSIFLSELEKSDFFSAVELEQTKQIEERDVKIQLFSLGGKISYSGAPVAAETPAAPKG